MGSFRGDTLEFKKIFEEIPDRRLLGKVPPSFVVDLAQYLNGFA